MEQQPVTPLSANASRSQSVSGDETLATPETGTDTKSTVFEPPIEEGEVGTLGAYRIVKELGHGGMGAVYAAVDTRLDRRLAMKVMLPEAAASPTAKERFLREARAAARIKHDNVVTIYEADERNGVPYIAMEFLAGLPLDAFIRMKGTPSISQLVRISMETASGLAAAHKLGLIHRDIKPGNLWLEAPKGRVKVLDFGLAKMVDGGVELTKSGTMVGTPAYMSPEQAQGERVDARADLFSLGAVMYRLCTGQLPFPGTSIIAILTALATQEPPPVRSRNPDVPDLLAELIHQLMAKNAEARPQTAAEVVTRLRKLAAERSGSHSQPIPTASVVGQPQSVYASIPMNATAKEVNPFADIYSGATVPVPPVPTLTPDVNEKPTRKKPGFPLLWVLAGMMGFIAMTVCGIVIVIRNKDGSETTIDVPDHASVTIREKNDRPPPKPAISDKPASPPSPVADPDRKAAEWVLSMGGGVRVSGVDREIKDFKGKTNLPKEPFQLTSVWLIVNQDVTDAGLAYFKDCKHLTYLNLYRTQITDAGLVNFKDCNNLKELSLNNTQVTDAGMVYFKDCNNLTFLNLNNTQVSDAGLAYFKDCNNLTFLDLYHTQVTDAGLAYFKDCKNLTKLSLSNTKISDAGLANFKDCKKLEKLDLYNTRLTDAGLANFKDCKKLTELQLQKTKVTEKGIADFHAAVPGCRIEHDGGIIEPTK